jgi:hypothetical protein
METFAKIFGAVFMAALLGLLSSLLFSLPVMVLWNHVLVELIPSIREATWFQACGMIALCSCLFARFGKS